MNTDPACRRRYRRLLWAYPRWYRRERGREILTTLLDAAAPDRRWPSARDAADLLRGGLRRRVGPPRAGYLFLFVPVSVFVGLWLSALTFWLAVDRLAPMPSVEVAANVAQLATGDRPRDLPGPGVSCYEGGCPFAWSHGGDQVIQEDRLLYVGTGQDTVEVGYWPDNADLARWTQRAHDRLAAAGWTVDAIDFETYGYSFTARTADLQVRVAAIPGLSPDGNLLNMAPAGLVVQHAAPPNLDLLSEASFLAGLALGWLLTAWVVRRGRGHYGRRQTALLLTAIAGVLLTTALDSGALIIGGEQAAFDYHEWARIPRLLDSPAIIAIVPAVAVLLTTIPLATWPRGLDHRQRAMDSATTPTA